MTAVLDAVRREELRKLAEAATPGPWTYFYKKKYNEHQVSLPTDGSMRLALFDDGCQTERPEEDAAYIAAMSPDTTLALLAYIAELEAGRDELRKIAETLGCADDPYAAWESLEALLSVLRFYADPRAYRQLTEQDAKAAFPFVQTYSGINRPAEMVAKAIDGYVLPSILSDWGKHATAALAALPKASVREERE